MATKANTEYNDIKKRVDGRADGDSKIDVRR
jgi:hypothetical protein